MDGYSPKVELEEVLNDRRSLHFLALDESQDGNTFRGGGGGFFEKRFYTVFLLFRLDRSENNREAGMDEVRMIYHKIHSKLLKDRKELSDMFFVDENLQFNEIDYVGNNCAGLMFHLINDEAIDLTYDPNEWS